jgi:hypothetical protein
MERCASSRPQEILRVNVNCAHLEAVQTSRANSQICEDCLRLGDSWVHLRPCGHVGCCDSSRNMHATTHYHASGHPIVTSLEPGETYVELVLRRSVDDGVAVMADVSQVWGRVPHHREG